MKKSICVAAMVAAMLLPFSCKANKPAAPEASGAAKVETIKSDFSFLKKLGIDPADSLLMGNRLETADDKIVMLGLNEKQRKALLGDVFEGEDADYGNFCIIGVRALPGDYTLVVYHIEFGDGSDGLVAIYDRNGKLIDCCQTGPWDFKMPDFMNDDYTAGVMREEHNVLDMVSNNSFKITNSVSKYDVVAVPLDGEDEGVSGFKKVKDQMSITKEYNFTVDKNGHLKMETPKVLDKKGATAHDLLLDEIDGMFKAPKYDVSILDKVNAIAAKPEVKASMGSEEDEVGYRLEAIINRVFAMNPQGLLKWLASHRDLTKNHVVTIFESLFSEGAVDKYLLYQQIQKMPAGADKDYLEKLTGQWGPAGAVG